MVAQNMFCTYNKYNRSFPKKKVGFDDAIDVTKCLQQIEIRDLLNICAPCSELPSYVRLVTTVDLSKCLNQSNRRIYTCATISKQPSNMSTMGLGE